MPHMISWTERQYYSIQTDTQRARISGFDDHGGEHWQEIEVASLTKQDGGNYRERRDEAVLAIQDAIEAGHEPGEVK